MKPKNKSNKLYKIKVWCICIAILLTLIVPFLINLCYSLPFVIIHTRWNASDVLNYYGSLLEMCATVCTFAFSVYFALVQIRHGQEMSKELKMWEEIELKIDRCIDDIHPYKLKYASLNVSTEKDNQSAYKLISHVYAYGITATISVDKMERSKTKTDFSELNNLINEIKKISQKMNAIAEKYRNVYQEAYFNVLRSNSVPNPEYQEECLRNFGEAITEFEGEIELVYSGDFLELYRLKNDFFRNKYDEISRKKPQFF